MSGYLERLIHRGRGRASAATLLPRRDAPAAEELPGGLPAEILEVAEQRETEIAASRPPAEPPALEASATPVRSTAPRTGASTPLARALPLSPVAARDRGRETATRHLASRPEPTAAPSPPTPQNPSPPLNAPAAVAADHGQPQVDRKALLASTLARTIGPAGATERAVSERPATAVLARQQAVVEPEVVSPPRPASSRLLDDVRFDGDAEPRIEVHIDRVEVLQSTTPPSHPPASPPPRQRHRGFAELAATRGHARRRWS